MNPPVDDPSITEIGFSTLARDSRWQGSRSSLVGAVRRALELAIAGAVPIDPDLLKIGGMSGRKYRMFINALIGNLADARYLEVGSWAGSTLCAAIHGNHVTALAIDNWSEFGGPREAFHANLAHFMTPGARVRFTESDFRAVDYAACGRFNVYLFDGPHEPQDQYDGIMLAQPALDDEFVLIVDDWNWPRVRAGTLEALARVGLDVRYMVEIRSTLDDCHPAVAFQDSDWHNGYFIGVLNKNAA